MISKYDNLRKVIAVLLLILSIYILQNNVSFLAKEISGFSGLSFFFLTLNTLPFIALGIYWLWISIFALRKISKNIVCHISISYSFVFTFIFIIIYDIIMEAYFEKIVLENSIITIVVCPVFVLFFGCVELILTRLLSQCFLGNKYVAKDNRILKILYLIVLFSSLYLSCVTLLHSLLENILNIEIDKGYNFLLYAACYIVPVPSLLLSFLMMFRIIKTDK